MRSLKVLEDRLQRSRNPEMRALVRELVARAAERGLTVSDLYRGLAGIEFRHVWK
ncbi:MAG: hypothetical protein AB1776_02895 [Bacillota bacterium]